MSQTHFHRLEPLSIEELCQLEEEKECHAVITRAQGKKESEERVGQCAIEEKDGTFLRKGQYDLVFHLVPYEQNTLRDKITNKFGIVNFAIEFHKYQNWQYYRLISNQFSNRNNINDTQTCIQDSLLFMLII